MSESEVIMKLLAEVADKARPAIPLSVDQWDIATIAQYLKKTPAHVRERIACLPSFPKAFRVPSTTGRGQPLYKATEVIAWTESHQDKN